MGTGLLISVIIIVIAAVFSFKYMRKDASKYIVPANARQLLSDHVTFYSQLDDANKLLFETRIKDFLENVMIRGVDVKAEDLDRVLVAAGAIIPIFAFPDWKYNNISEVLLYKDTFDKDFKTTGVTRNVLGMVGDGAMRREMLLSQPSLRASFRNAGDGHNTAIHEFAHLIDKADGEADGLPEYLLEKPYILPWISLMHDTIEDIKRSSNPDINPYGAANDAEFFAVISEYFFERPNELKEHHAELYVMLERMFHPPDVTA